MDTSNLPKVQHEKITTAAIAATVRTNRAGIIALLKKHGVAIDSGYSDQEIIVGLLQAIRSSKRFRDDLAPVLAGVVSKSMASFTGAAESGAFYYNVDGEAPGGDPGGVHSGINDVINGGNSSTVKKPGFFSGANLTNLFNTGLSVLSTTLANKSNQQLANTALQIEQEKTKQSALAGIVGKGAAGTNPGMSTGAKIAIALGILTILGLGAYFLFFKKKGKAKA